MPGRPLGPALRSFCLSLGSLGLSLGRLGAPLGCLGTHFGAPGAALGCLGDALGPLWDTLGSMLGCLGIILGHIGHLVSAGTPTASRWLSSTAPAHKNRPAGTCIRMNQCDVRNGPRTGVSQTPSNYASCRPTRHMNTSQ